MFAADFPYRCISGKALRMNHWIGKADWKGGLIWLVLAIVATLSFQKVSKQLADGHLESLAEQTASDYAAMLGQSVSGLHGVLETGEMDAWSLAQLRNLGKIGSVFRFRLFDKNGALLLVSDKLDQPDHGAGGELLGHGPDGELDEDIADLLVTGEPVVRLCDGEHTADTSGFYTEAFVPVRKDGKIIGVVEVHVNQTPIKSAVMSLFARLSLLVAGVLGVLFAIAAFQFLRRMRERAVHERRFRYLAQHDQLSGALNRSSFTDALRRAEARAKESGERFALLYLDLDEFKYINDTHGHRIGDVVIASVAERLADVLRHGDVLARLGGDEFAILQHTVRDSEDVKVLAARVLAAIGRPHRVENIEFECRCSVGAAIFGVDAVDCEALLNQADLALYRAKEHGRGGFSFYDENLDQLLRRRRELTSDLRQAIEDETLTLAYQKLFAADGSTAVGYEALLRWQHPVHGPIGPEQFIAIAEEAGFIARLGEWVLNRACNDAVTWPRDLSVAVNLSPAQFERGDIVVSVINALERSGLEPERLELEITESLLMQNTDDVIRSLEALNNLGVRISMDDFGTGHSSLAYLWQFPFHKLKIDRSFTKALEDDARVSEIVRSIVSLAHSLHIRVNAEGVETATQLAALQAHGCDEFQGFLLAKPAALDMLDMSELESTDTTATTGARRNDAGGAGEDDLDQAA
ncbi:MAG: GGDEF-domain containing protein [Gammaproteobacteria bacterium]|nr:MAG: GGDEF-domain containing protein [Gammaproteobacteria bacterium]